MKKVTAAWVRKAEADFRAARSLASDDRPHHDQVVFLCQQTAEKFFKALLQELGFHIPRTHDLDDLLDLLLPHDNSLQKLRRGLSGMAEFAVDYRYPGVHANRRKAQSALRLAGRVRREIRLRLGLRFSSS